jgi:hypothetical protein
LLFILGTILPGLFYSSIFHNLEKNLSRILYYDFRGFNPESLTAHEYFLRREVKGDKEADKEFKDEECFEVENNLKLKENDVGNYQLKRSSTGDIIMNSIENGNQDDEMEKSNRFDSRPRFTIGDYSALNPDDSILYDRRRTYEYLLDLITLEHPIANLIFKKSLKEPVFIKLLKLTFSLSLQFGLNAVLFTDYYIDKRQEDQDSVN